MRHSLFGLTVITLFAFGSVAQAESFKRIKDQATFEAQIVGKKLTGEGGTVTVKKGGKLTGRFDKQRLKGSWVWQNGLFCRKVQLGKAEPRGACQRVTATSDKVRFTTTKGGRVTTYSY